MKKIATDLEQSKKLAEILPIESADMYYHNTSIRGINYVDAHQLEAKPYNTTIGTSWFEAYKKHNPMFEVVPAWSLSALMDILPHEIIFDCKSYNFKMCTDVYSSGEKYYDLGYQGVGYWLEYVDSTDLVDACYEMILKLHELNLL